MDHVMEDSGHIVLISGAYVLKAERGDRVVEVNHGCLEGGLLGVTKVRLNLVVASKSVHEGEH